LLARRTTDAVRDYDRALAIASPRLPAKSEHLDVLRMRRALARAHGGDAASAEKELSAIVAAFDKAGFNSRSRAYAALGEAQRLAGRYAIALATQKQAQGLVTEGPTAARERMAIDIEIGLNALALGNPSTAIASLESGLKAMQHEQPYPTPLLREAVAALGRAKVLLARDREATAHE
jgi:tetratricopeptide (TPR) repeat protein